MSADKQVKVSMLSEPSLLMLNPEEVSGHA